MNLLQITNEGPDILSTNYWGSEQEEAGKIFCSVNAGCVRILLPRSSGSLFYEWKSARYVILSRGPWPDQGLSDAVEILFEDGSQSPYCLHLSANSFDLLPAEPDYGREWSLTAWAWNGEKPEKVYSRTCKWRRSERLPDLSPWRD